MNEKTFSGISNVLFHKIEWYFNTGDLNISSELGERLKEEAESKARLDIIAEHYSGELCFSALVENKEVKYFGWWMFEDED